MLVQNTESQLCGWLFEEGEIRTAHFTRCAHARKKATVEWL
jgi:hypothetical protein